jgi:hypothetical protein
MGNISPSNIRAMPIPAASGSAGTVKAWSGRTCTLGNRGFNYEPRAKLSLCQRAEEGQPKETEPHAQSNIDRILEVCPGLLLRATAVFFERVGFNFQGE